MMDFIHNWTPGKAGRTVLLLHGTGGDENDLLDLGRMVAPDASFLSPRGKVLERGMPRFFRRLAEGVFDLDDLRLRTHELADWIGESARRYHFDFKDLVALGYSNGANIAASLLLTRPEVLGDAILLRAMLPFEPETTQDLSTKRVLLANGQHDTIIPLASATRLAEVLRSGGAKVTFNISASGHGLEQSDIDEASDWYRTLFKPPASLT